jgi:hypothetical protein
MLRFISHLFKLNYEACKSCYILENQLSIVRAENERLLQTILGFVKPEVIPQSQRQVEPIIPKSMAWHTRKRLLENEARAEARLFREAKELNKKLGIDESIDDLEKELGVNEDAN